MLYRVPCYLCGCWHLCTSQQHGFCDYALCDCTISQWNGRCKHRQVAWCAGPVDGSFCTTSEGLFASGELAYDEAQSTVYCTGSWEVHKKLQVRQGIPNVAHLERSDCGIAPELSNDDADCSLGGLIASGQVQRQLAFNVGCSDVEVMVPSQGMNAREWRMLLVDHSLVGWTAHWEVQENNAGKAGGSNCCTYRTIRTRDCARTE